MKYDVQRDRETNRWVSKQTRSGLLTKQEADRVCQIKNGTNVPGPNVFKRPQSLDEG